MRVFDAGHMVPMDQPAAALSMLEQFIAGKI
jgi:carboxypeptidase C (cathepsin A)